jgi:hypothetical protein
VDRLTREEIEYQRQNIAKGMRAQEWPTKTLEHNLAQLNALCDLALQSLSQEAVRDEVLAALEEAARRYPNNAAVAFLFGAIGPTGTITAADLATLKREPNAATQDNTGLEDRPRGTERLPNTSGPAPAAPDHTAPGECCCAIHHPNYGRCLQCPIHGTLPPGASDD